MQIKQTRKKAVPLSFLRAKKQADTGINPKILLNLLFPRDYSLPISAVVHSK